MSDDSPQFPEQPPRRQFRPKIFLVPETFVNEATTQEVATDVEDARRQKEVQGEPLPSQEQLEEMPTVPLLVPQYKQKAQPFALPASEKQKGWDRKRLEAYQRPRKPGLYSLNGVNGRAEVEAKDTLRMARLKLILDLQDQLPAMVQYTDDLEVDRRATIPLTMVRGITELQDQPPTVPQYADDLEFDQLATIPMAVLKGISDLQGQPTPVMQSEISGAASNAALIALGNIAGNIFKYANNLLIQRGFGAGPYGLYSLGLSMVTLFVSVFNLGLDDAMVRYVSIYRGKKQSNLLRGLALFCTTLTTVGGILGGLLMLFIAPSLASIRHAPDVVPLLLLMAPLIPLLSVQGLWSSGLQGFKAFKSRILLQRLIIPGLLTVLLVLVLLFCHNILAAIIASIVSTAISAALNMNLFFSLVSRLKSRGAREYAIREWCSFAIPNLLTSVVDMVLEASDTLLLAYFVLANGELGRYAAANKISIFITMPLLSLNVTFAPTIAELFSKGEKQKLTIMFQVVTKWVITFSLPLCLIAMLFSRSLLGISGESFVAAWPLLLALAVGNMINAGTGPVGYMLVMTGFQKLSFINSLTAVVVNIVLGLILTPRYGAMGTAIATGLALAVVNLMRLLQVKLLLKIHPYRWDTIKPLGAGLLSALLTGLLLYPMNFISLPFQVFHKNIPIQLALIPVFLACYIGLLILFKVSPEDKIVLDRLRKKLVRGKK
jgi:O-antigen/teichoic acid export membrane protein